jgi:serine/threonine-protein kinase RsbW
MSSPDVVRSHKRTFPSSLDAYHGFVQDVLDGLANLGWSQSDLFGVHMALEESISNAIRHGNKEDPAKRVEVACQIRLELPMKAQVSGPRKFPTAASLSVLICQAAEV